MDPHFHSSALPAIGSCLDERRRRLPGRCLPPSAVPLGLHSRPTARSERVGGCLQEHGAVLVAWLFGFWVLEKWVECIV